MDRYKLWEEEIPLFDENINNIENLNCCTIKAFLTEEDEEDKGIKRRGAMIICPGGGYSFCAEAEGEKVARWLNFFGVNAFVLNYRVAPYRHPAPLIDAKRAIRYVRYNFEKFNISPGKVGIMGFSAGGHLAGCVAEFFDQFEVEEKDEIDKISAKPNLAVLCYPVVSLCEDYAHKGSALNLVNGDKELLYKLSLEKSIREDMPRIFAWHTAEDNVVNVRNTLELGIALKEKNVPYSLHIFQNGDHGLVLAADTEETKLWTDYLKVILKNEGFMDNQSYRWL